MYSGTEALMELKLELKLFQTTLKKSNSLEEFKIKR